MNHSRVLSLKTVKHKISFISKYVLRKVMTRDSNDLNDFMTVTNNFHSLLNTLIALNCIFKNPLNIFYVGNYQYENSPCVTEHLTFHVNKRVFQYVNVSYSIVIC